MKIYLKNCDSFMICMKQVTEWVQKYNEKLSLSFCKKKKKSFKVKNKVPIM